MGIIKSVIPVKLFTGIIAADLTLLQEAEAALTKQWDKIDSSSEIIPFDFTDYYHPEMGRELYRCWLSFEGLMDPGQLVRLKGEANKLEESFAINGKRRVNIDPGYLTMAKIVLASTKDFNHRIYIGGGIYAEVTMYYRHDKFVTLAWTYPDYQCETALKFFTNTRVKLREQLKHL